MFFCFFFFFNSKANHDIYTYLHTLSLHAALPICLFLLGEGGEGRSYQYLHPQGTVLQGSGEALPTPSALCRCERCRQSCEGLATAQFPHLSCRLSPCRRPARRGMGRVLPRSEEHTSELQSLMRISYAVFCLKKHTKNQ